MSGSNQFAKLTLGTGDYVEVDIDPTFGTSVSEAWMSALVYVPSTAQADLSPAVSGSPSTVLDGNNLAISIRKTSGTYHWFIGSGDFAPFTFDSWVQVETHQIAGSSLVDIKIDGTLYSGLSTGFGAPIGVSWYAGDAISSVVIGAGGGSSGDDWIGFDELSWSLDTWISDGGAAIGRWSFDGADPLGDADANYPNPPWTYGSASIATGGGVKADYFNGGIPEEGGGGPGHTQAIDLSFISYRAFFSGDTDNNQSIGNLAEGTTYPIDLSAIKYRAYEFGDTEGN